MFFYLLLLLAFCAAIIWVNYIVSKKFEEIAIRKGHYNSHSFAMCFWLNTIGYLYVIALPNIRPQTVIISEASNSKKATNELTAKHYCPYCERDIPYGISTCPSCNLKLNWENK